jgi:hypothetical protein
MVRGAHLESSPVSFELVHAAWGRRAVVLALCLSKKSRFPGDDAFGDHAPREQEVNRNLRVEHSRHPRTGGRSIEEAAFRPGWFAAQRVRAGLRPGLGPAYLIRSNMLT